MTFTFTRYQLFFAISFPDFTMVMTMFDCINVFFFWQNRINVIFLTFHSFFSWQLLYPSFAFHRSHQLILEARCSFQHRLNNLSSFNFVQVTKDKTISGGSSHSGTESL